MPESRLLFVHIPKSAGMSLYNALSQSLGKDSALRFPDGSEQNKKKFLDMDNDFLRKHQLISGHFSLPFFRQKQLKDYNPITIVRNPIDRELSAYFYMKTWELHPRHQQIKSMNFFDYLDYREKNSIVNPQCWHVCGSVSFEKAVQAIDNDYFLAAPIEYISKFCSILEIKLGLKQINLKQDNKTSFRMSAEEIHPDIISRIENYTKGDMKLYLYVKNKFEKEYFG